MGQAGETIGQVGQTVGEGAGQAVGQVGFRFDRFMQASPLALGAIAIGAGAVAGALVPETSKEQEMLGDAGQKIGELVRDGVDQATSKAEEALDRTEEKVAAS